jgi:hypothetical protein
MLRVESFEGTRRNGREGREEARWYVDAVRVGRTGKGRCVTVRSSTPAFWAWHEQRIACQLPPLPISAKRSYPDEGSAQRLTSTRKETPGWFPVADRDSISHEGGGCHVGMPSLNCHGDFCALISALIQADAELLEVAIPFFSLTVSSSSSSS